MIQTSEPTPTPTVSTSPSPTPASTAQPEATISPTPTPTPAPTLTATLTFSPPSTPVIQATIPLGGNTVTESYSSRVDKEDIYSIPYVDCERLSGAANQECLDKSNKAAVAAVAVTAAITAPFWASQVGAGAGLASIYATNVLASLPASVQTALTVGGTLAGGVGLLQACGNGNYASNECAAAITGLQVAQMSEQAASSAYRQTQRVLTIQSVDDLAATRGTLFANDAAGLFRNDTYKASSGQKLIINPEKDPLLQEHMQKVER